MKAVLKNNGIICEICVVFMSQCLGTKYKPGFDKYINFNTFVYSGKCRKPSIIYGNNIIIRFNYHLFTLCYEYSEYNNEITTGSKICYV